MRRLWLVGVGFACVLGCPAWADDASPSTPASFGAGQDAGLPLRLSWLYDGSTVVASAVTLGLATLVPVDRSTRWNTQLLPFDDHLKGRYSSKAATVSDVLLGADLAAPVILLSGLGLDRELGKRVIVYGETLLVGLAADAVVKSLVARPRPYVYSEDPTVMAYAQSEGKDSHLSFYSRHASTAFSASVAGAYLFAQSTSDIRARAAVWGTELALAGATADLRTRAGMHFYSDVLAGAAIGSSLGVLIPYLHGGPSVHLDKLEWLAIVLGPLIGVAVGQLLPVGN
jgi:membrane-associated phospholipid phosphatase